MPRSWVQSGPYRPAWVSQGRDAGPPRGWGLPTAQSFPGCWCLGEGDVCWLGPPHCPGRETLGETPHLGLGLPIHKKEARPPCDRVLCEDAWPLTSPSAAPRPAPTHPPPPLQPAVLSGEGLPVSPGAWPEPRAPHSIPGRQYRWSGLLGAVFSACRSVRRLGLPWCALGPAAWPGSVTSEALPGELGSSASGLSPRFCPPDLSRVLAQVPFVLGLGGQGPRGGRRDRKRQGGRLGPWSLS